jgi:hypothetical protein
MVRASHVLSQGASRTLEYGLYYSCGCLVPVVRSGVIQALATLRLEEPARPLLHERRGQREDNRFGYSAGCMRAQGRGGSWIACRSGQLRALVRGPD